MRFKHLICIFAILPFGLSAQNYTTKKTTNAKAKEALDASRMLRGKGDFDKSVISAKKALKEDPQLIDAHIELGATQYKAGRLVEAEAAFEQVEKIDPNYEPEVLYSLGNIESKQEKYLEAAAHYERYAESTKLTTKDKKKGEKAGKQARFIAYALQHPVPFNPISAGAGVNTPQYSEYLPSVSADEATLVYTVLQGKQEDLYHSQKINNEWQKGFPLEEINTDDNEGGHCLSADGKTIFYTACGRQNPYLEGAISCDIWVSYKVNNTWTKPRPITDIGINTKSWESQPSISADGQTLYFASNRAGGKGGLDIWVSKKVNGRWGEPQNMGEPINTAEDDQTPFIHPDGQTLYFTSEGHIGMGGKDIFISRLQADGTWGTPENLGYPINTKDSEGTICVSLDGKTAYYGRGLPTAATRLYDIYNFEMPVAVRPQPVNYLKALVYDKETEKRLVAKLEFVDLASQKIFLTTQTDENGDFLVCLPYGKNYALNVSCKGYSFASENFNLTDTNTLQAPFLLAIGLVAIKTPTEMQPVKPTQTPTKPEESKAIVLKNVFFETNQAILLPASVSELTRLKLLLEENPAMNIEIRGHTDNVGNDADNQSLSERRAQAVVRFLIENGIASNRLTSKGFGETQPIATNDTPEGRAQNRRTEFVILSK